jgi:rhomboid protease GluP
MNFSRMLERTPISTYILLINIGAFIAIFLDTSNTLLYYGFNNSFLVIEQGEYWRIISSGFIHEDFLHVFFNMYFGIFYLSMSFERIFGSKKFSIIYFSSLIGSGIIVALFTDPNTYTIGASGAIYGIFGAYLFMAVFRKDIMNERFARQIYWVLAINLGISILPGISLSGHLGGLITGFLLSFVLIGTSDKRYDNDYFDHYDA